MKVKIEISENEAPEIVIKCREINDEVLRIQSLLAGQGSSEMPLYIGEDEYYVPRREILFFETSCGKVYAHTKDKMLLSEYKLFEIEEMMGAAFIRVSKSTVVNVMQISSLHKDITGSGEIRFKNTHKTTYFSRGYAKILKCRIEEMRFGK